VTRFALTFAGCGPYCASLNSNLLLHDHRAAVNIPSSPAVVRTRILAPLVGAHAVTMTSKRERLLGGSSAVIIDFRAELLDRRRA
jgi:hypothetical protein